MGQHNRIITFHYTSCYKPAWAIQARCLGKGLCSYEMDLTRMPAPIIAANVAPIACERGKKQAIIYSVTHFPKSNSSTFQAFSRCISSFSSTLQLWQITYCMYCMPFIWLLYHIESDVIKGSYTFSQSQAFLSM